MRENIDFDLNNNNKKNEEAKTENRISTYLQIYASIT